MDTEITIRTACPADAGSIERLAQLDTKLVPAGPLLLAERGSRPIAALTIDGREAIADPFAHTMEAVELLRFRASQLSAVDEGGFRLRGWAGFARLLRATH